MVHKQEISQLILVAVSRFSSIVLNCHVNNSLLLIRPLPLIDSVRRLMTCFIHILSNFSHGDFSKCQQL